MCKRTDQPEITLECQSVFIIMYYCTSSDHFSLRVDLKLDLFMQVYLLSHKYFIFVKCSRPCLTARRDHSHFIVLLFVVFEFSIKVMHIPLCVLLSSKC